jgi:hypothetical protein
MRSLNPIALLAALSIGLSLAAAPSFAQNTDQRYPTPPSAGSAASGGSTATTPNYDPRYVASPQGQPGSGSSTSTTPNYDPRYSGTTVTVDCKNPANAQLSQCKQQ